MTPEPTNEERGARARATLVSYIGSLPPAVAVLEQPDIACLIDLITDSMHLFGREGVEEAFNHATVHYNAETGD